MHSSDDAFMKSSLKPPAQNEVWKGNVFLLFIELDVNETPFGLVIPLLGMYPKNPETPIQKNINKHPYVHSSIIDNGQDLETVSETIRR